jgi:hypothetical protein
MMRRLISILLLSIVSAGCLFPQKTDPYHKESGGFGKILLNDKLNKLWWCEGAYKVMTDTPAPGKKSKRIEISAAGNEYEPFQLVFNPSDTLHNLNITIDNLQGTYGEISAENFEIRTVEYVRITKPTDSYGYSGLWPDPLPTMEKEIDIYPGINNTLWFTLYIPPTCLPGIYNTSLKITSDSWSAIIPISVTVWDFILPKEASIRSGFGLSVDKIAAYHNISNQDDLNITFDLYMQAFRDYKISPYNFYYLNKIEKMTSGINWTGGIYDSEDAFDGKYSFRADDNSYTSDPNISYIDHIPINTSDSYTLNWVSKSSEQEHQYTIVIEAYNENDSILVFETLAEAFKSDTSWKSNTFSLGRFGKDVRRIKLSLYPAFRTISGEHTGTTWFDKLRLSSTGSNDNLLSGSDFEVIADSININLDFAAFDTAAERYLDDFGFNGFRLNLEGMGGGTYYSRTEGVFEGFEEGTQEYKILMEQYLRQIQSHLREKNWLGKEYIYWFDEPGAKDYPFVRKGMELIKKSAPEISTFLTENEPGPEIMDVTDITCTILNRIDRSNVKTVRENDGQYWSYICTGPKAPWISEFIDHDAINLRMWLWMSYAYDLNGILVWSTNYWTSRSASPAGYLQNPWTEPASYVQGYGWPLGKQTNWGNGDGRFWYPPNRKPNTDKKSYIEGPIPSIRLEFLRQGIEDYEYLLTLENLLRVEKEIPQVLRKKGNSLLSIPEEILVDGKTYTKNPALLYKHRQKIAETIVKINKSLE